MNLQELKEPLGIEDIDFRIQSINKGGDIRDFYPLGLSIFTKSLNLHETSGSFQNEMSFWLNHRKNYGIQQNGCHTY